MISELQQTPLSGWHSAHSGRMVGFSGWLMPVQYSSIVAEHRATRSAVGLFDISHMGRFRFEGEGANGFLDRLLTRGVSNIVPGQIRYSLVTNDKGGVLDDVLVYCQEGAPQASYLLVVNAGNREKIAGWIRDHLSTGDKVDFQDQTKQTAMIAVQGPSASSAIVAVVDAKWTALKYYNVVETTVFGQRAVLSRTGYTGEDGYELIVPAEIAEQVWENILSAAAESGALPVGLGARDTLRLEAGMPLYGHELNEDIDPYQAGLGFAVQLQDRQFIGRDALAEIKNQPRSKVRIGLELAGRRVPREGYSVLVAGERVGEVTSGTFSPTLERPIAMAYVRPDVANVGADVEVEIRGRRETAIVVNLPFYSRAQD